MRRNSCSRRCGSNQVRIADYGMGWDLFVNCAVSGEDSVSQLGEEVRANRGEIKPLGRGV
jgi:hypothetical protein